MAEQVVALLGLRGSGKSTLGRALSELLEVAFVDLDERLALLHDGPPAPRPAGSILEELGEPRFRELETEALRTTLVAPAPFVLATGGGVVERSENRALLADRCRCVWLDADPEVLLERIEKDPTPRPPLTDLDRLREVISLAERRASLYSEVAELKLDSGRSGIKSLTIVIRDWLYS
jgi:shikimate kinase